MSEHDTKPPHRAVGMGAPLRGRAMPAATMLAAAILAAAGCTPDAAPGGANSAGAERANAKAAVAPADGARIYSANCQSCHGPDGRGMPGVFPSLAHSPVAEGDPAALALWVLKGRRPASMPASKYSAGEMPSFAWMKSADAAALFTYVRSSFGNSAPPVETSVIDAALSN